MSSLAASSQSNIKQVIRTALVGIRPADQVMLKGYLRVLLRLEADLEWVSANHPQVDLYMINEDFRSSASVTKLLSTQQNKPVLYVSRSLTGEGVVEADKVVLPLKKLHGLNDWLKANLAVLDSKAQRRVSIPEQEMEVGNRQPTSSEAKVVKNPAQDSGQQDGTKQTAQPTEQTSQQKAPQSATVSGSYQDIISLIKTLQQRPEGLYQLLVDGQAVATVAPKPARLWVDTSAGAETTKLALSWQLQPYTGNAPDAGESVDMNQWLWDKAWAHPNELLPLISDDASYQLRFWIKPSSHDRRELLRLMTALEQTPRNVNQLANLSGTSINTAKKTVASLLLSGSLQPSSYADIKVGMTHGSSQASQAAGSSTSASGQASTGSEGSSTLPTENAATTAVPKVSTLDSVLARRAAGDTSSTTTSSEIPSIRGASGVSSSADSKAEPAQPSAASSEKSGFLSKLRRKLGL